MRVVFLTHNYPRFPGDLPGAFLHPLARALRDRGLDVRVVAPSDAGRGGRDELDGIPVTRVRYAAPERERLAYTGAMLEALRSPRGVLALMGLGRALRAGARGESSGHGATVVHAHWWVPAGLAAPPELPLVLTLHGTDGALARHSALARALARPVLRRARAVTTVSADLAETVRRVTPQVTAAVQPMPVDTREWGWTTGGGGVVVVSRLTRQKRVHLAIEATALLVRRHIPIRMTVIGEGPERITLEALARRLAVEESVFFTGALPPPAARSHLLRADLALQLGLGEGFGLAAAEALISGVPVVACEDGGGLLDVVPRERAGRIVAPAPESLARGITELLDDPGAGAAAREIGAGWRTRLAPGTVAERFEAWYRQALRG